MLISLAAFLVTSPAFTSLAPVPTALPQEPPPAQVAPTDPLSRVAVLGASVSAGMGNASELRVRKDVPLGVFLQGALQGDLPNESPFLDLGNTYFFMEPYVHAELQVARAKKFDPTLVIALDFLFWFAYGEPWAKGERRAAGLEAGLNILDRLDAPIVIGDLPDIDHALAGVGPLNGPIVTRAMFPSSSERLEMNARLAEWAKARGNVTIVPLDGLMTKMVGGVPVRIRGNEWTVTSLPDALQRDRLHPTVKGSAWTGLFVADAIARLSPPVEGRFLFDPDRVQARVETLTQEARAAKLRSSARLAKKRAAWKRLRERGAKAKK